MKKELVIVFCDKTNTFLYIPCTIIWVKGLGTDSSYTLINGEKVQSGWKQIRREAKLLRIILGKLLPSFFHQNEEKHLLKFSIVSSQLSVFDNEDAEI